MKIIVLIAIITHCSFYCKSQSKKIEIFPREISDSTFVIVLINNINCSSINYGLDEKVAEIIGSNPNITFKVITNTIERRKEYNYYRRLWNLKNTDILIGSDDTLSFHLVNLLKIDNFVSKWNSCLVLRKKNRIIVKPLNPS